MNKKLNFCLKVGLGLAGCVAAIGAAQATTLTSLGGAQGNMSWQNIASASYTFSDTNHDGLLNPGEVLTFTVEMDKKYWGMHVFDALKVWIGGQTYTAQWDFSNDSTQGNPAMDYNGGVLYTLPNHFFDFTYTPTAVGALDIYASVMCNADLSTLYNDGKYYADGSLTTGSLATPSTGDWAAWSPNIHQGRWLQGEDERFQLTVVQQPVPEPETYAMLLAGLGLIAPLARRRKAKQ